MSLPLLRPFAGLRPAPVHAAQVAAPPYDVVSSDEARDLAHGNPFSFLHISKPEIDLAPGIDPYAPEVYAKARENLDAMVAQGVLVRDAHPCFYVYRLTMGEHVQTGLVGGASVAAYDVNRIRKHEFTRPDKEDDRVRQIDACDAQTGPVLLAHPAHPDLSAVIAQTVASAPAYTVTTAHDGVEHSLWVVDDAALIAKIQAAYDSFPAVYIADGHHRSAAASRVAKTRDGSPDAAHNSFLVVSFPIDEMNILDYNRVVKDLNGLTLPQFLTKVAEHFTIVPQPENPKPTAPQEFGMYLQGVWHILTPKAPPPADPVARLDVSLLSDRLLGPVLGITDLRKDKRIDFVGGRRGLAELERRVNSGEMAVAFALFATQMTDLVAVAEAGEVMPPKSTWFEPKLADGLCSYPLK